jgi:tetratricopeptide (TPR) repeat protein
MPFRTKNAAPANYADFERLCLRLLKAYWKCTTLELFGRRGERQSGIDILDVGGADPLRAAQCKLYDPSKTLPPAEIKAEIQAARKFRPAIGVYALLTTARVSTEAQKSLIEIRREHRDKNLFLVDLFTWDRIDELLDEYPAIRDQEYRTLSGEAVRQVQEGLTEINARLSTFEVSYASSDADSTDALHAEIDEARSLIQKGDFQTGRFLLQRLRTNKWDRMGDRHRFRVLSNIGIAYLREQDYSRAAELLVEGAAFQTDDAQAGNNLALAYQLSLPAEQAFIEITKLREKFPASVLIASKWVLTAPIAFGFERIQGSLPASQLQAAEVLTALAIRALTECRFELCEQLASRSLERQPQASLPRLLKARSFMLQALPSLSALPASARIHQLLQAEQLFTEALSAATEEHDLALQAEALLERLHVYLLMEEPSKADIDAQHAFALLPKDPGVRRVIADMKLRHGQLDDAITGLEAVLADDFRPDAAIGLAHALRQRGAEADISKAIGLLQRVLQLQGPVALWGREYVASELLRFLIEEERWSDAEKVCETLETHGVSHALIAAYRARVEWLRGDSTEAGQLIDQSLASLSDDAPRDEVRWIAQLLSEVGRHSDALGLWLRIAPTNAFTEDTKQLLNCAGRLERHDVIMKTCATLRQGGVIEHDVVLFEVQTLQEYDLDGAIAVLQEYLAKFPDDKHVRLRLSEIGINRNRPSVVDATPTSMPPVHEVDVRTGRIAVHILKLGGYPDEALSYAYELLRLHFDAADAHLALMFNLHPIEPAPSIPDFDHAVPGTAVSYLEDGETQTHSVIIEDSPNPEASRLEFGPDHPLSIALLGKKVNDRFTLARGSISARMATVTSILSKYVFRYQDSLRNWQLRFPQVPAIESVKVFRVSKDGKQEPDFSALIASVEQLSAETERLKELYRSTPVPIHLFGAAVGKNTLETTIHLANSENGVVFCCAGSAEERKEALATLEVSNDWILEASSVATILLLNLEDLLQSLPISILMSQGTEAELDDMLAEATLFRGEGGVLTKLDGGIALVSVTPEQREERRQLLLKRIEKIKGACKIVACVELAAQDPTNRETMIKGLGQGGAESVILASKPGRLLWTDDFRLAGFARTEHGVRTVWTQVILQWAVAKGHAVEEQLVDCTARLVGFRYSFTSPDVPALTHAAKLAEWNPARWPLSAALDQLGSEAIHLRDAAMLAVALMDQAYRQAILDEQRRQVVRTLLDKLGSRPHGLQAVMGIKAAISSIFGLNVVGAKDALATVQAWSNRRRIQIAEFIG